MIQQSPTGFLETDAGILKSRHKRRRSNRLGPPEKLLKIPSMGRACRLVTLGKRDVSTSEESSDLHSHKFSAESWTRDGKAILVTMSHNLLAKIEYSSLVMRQVSGPRPELIRRGAEANTFLSSAALRLEKQQLFKTLSPRLGGSSGGRASGRNSRVLGVS